MNESLRQAIAQAHLTPHQLARACQVESRTVDRWLYEGRVPRPGTRAAVAARLRVEESVLWPAAAKAVMKTGPDREVVSVYPYRSSCPSAVWRGLITGAREHLTFAGYTNYFLWLDHPNLASVLRKKARSGTAVRFLLGVPDSDIARRREQVERTALTVSTRIRITLEHLARLTDVDGVQARYSDADQHISLSVFRFDDQMLVTPHLAYLVGHDSPMLHLRRLQDDGTFDRFAAHVETLWADGRPVGEG
ncbi:helix-turn-helix domain-containing protein [Streptomyces marincola]|uniref:helix-turn-helix domain-containing protein n=1 Tax=Streptomyces marincola TaxID=2878388 RepID=UPI001CF2DA7B|nr:helix-turn-helix domain-containing protein [Streptomyces marincola]UCM88803.1 helix-turn-helix domain-containing protein [Streptomyces marincola]